MTAEGTYIYVEILILSNCRRRNGEDNPQSQENDRVANGGERPAQRCLDGVGKVIGIFQTKRSKNNFDIFSNFAKHVPLFGSLCHKDQV